jgi:hypothetical protein
LPGDSYETFSQGVCDIINSGQHNKIQFNNLSILPNAELAAQVDEFKIRMIETPIVSIHGSIEDNIADDLIESQQLVIETYSMSQADWVKSRVFASYVECLYYCRLLQIVFIILHSQYDISYMDLFNTLIDADHDKFPVLAKLSNLFNNHAAGIVKGEAEFVYSKEWLDIFWPPGEYGFIYFTLNNLMDQFYDESYKLLLSVYGDLISDSVLIEAIKANKFLMNVPSRKARECLLTYNIVETYKNVLEGRTNKVLEMEEMLLFDEENNTLFSNEQDWLRYVVWYGHRNGSYLLKLKLLSLDIAGHY